MEPEVHLIEKYFQEILRCFTMTNIRLRGGKEIDLLAINPKTLERYHVESRVSTTLKLRLKATYTKSGKCHKDGVDYFLKEKFDHPLVSEKVQEIFGTKDYKRVLVVWDVFDLSIVPWSQANFNLHVWFIDDILDELMEKGTMKGSRDDILRTVELVALLQKQAKKHTRTLKRRLVRKALSSEKIEELGRGMLKFKKKIDEAIELERKQNKS